MQQQKVFKKSWPDKLHSSQTEPTAKKKCNYRDIIYICNKYIYGSIKQAHDPSKTKGLLESMAGKLKFLLSSGNPIEVVMGERSGRAMGYMSEWGQS